MTRINIEAARKSGSLKNPAITAMAYDGCAYRLNHTFSGVDSVKLVETVKAINEAGSIDPSKWTRIPRRLY